MSMIEILVVIGIIAILASLVAGGIILALRRGPEAWNLKDIGELSGSVRDFHAKNNQLYPPSKLNLYSSRSAYTGTALDVESLAYLDAFWPDLGAFTNMAWAG